MKIEIWSDIMCPFCYIGKRRFEQAVRQFGHKDKLEIVWKSFQLNPAMKTSPDQNINEYLARTKGWSLDEARRMNDHVTQMAENEGLKYDFDKAVVANSFDAHRLIQFAKTHGKGDATEEALFQAYFTEGKNIADHETLIQLASSLGLDQDEVRQVLQSDAYTSNVKQDVEEARRLGIRGVPFFVFNRTHGVSGAQSSEVFLDALNQAWEEWEKDHPASEPTVTDGAACTPDGDCE